MTKIIKISHGPYTLNFELKDNVVAVVGFSGAGKSFWFNKLPNMALVRDLPKIKYYSHVELLRDLDKDKERYFYFADDDFDILIVDNADLFFHEYEHRYPEKYRRDVSGMKIDTKHHYILVGRKLDFTLCPWQYSELKYDESTKTYYLFYPLIEMGVIS